MKACPRCGARCDRLDCECDDWCFLAGEMDARDPAGVGFDVGNTADLGRSVDVT